ncbi:MAG: tetratricopeptide repeat protein [Spirochaetaceae bacterium]|jgi:tetratricopeptide (TPR) repeat protein|nr:tetratricopeptide repeat protein [Spirochaetaceae bacterium]
MDKTDAETMARNLIQEAYNKMKEARPAEALEKLVQALRTDYRHQEALYALNCLNWWLERIKDMDSTGDVGPYNRGNFLLSWWKSYYGFLDIVGNTFDRCQYAVKRFVYGLALQNFSEVFEDGNMRHDPDLLGQIGRCYKGIGSYEQALTYLKQAANVKQEDAAIMAVLADVYALLGETKAAKALFREAFFIDPQAIDLRNLESELILELVRRVADMGHSGAELREWIPVYGALFGVFTVKRELKLTELGRLRQQIFDLENKMRGMPGDENVLTPALLNKYFRLMDYYEWNNRDHALIDEIKLKIKIIEPVIFDRYMS